MLADLLEKKSNPPVQVVQMNPQLSAPTIQITETGQIVQVKPEAGPLIQINPETGLVSQGSPFFQIKNEQGQMIQIKNDQGQIIQLKGDQLPGSMVAFKNEQGQFVTLKNDQGQFLTMKNDQGQFITVKNEQGQFIAIKSDTVPQGLIQAAKSEKDQLVDTVVTDHSYTEPPAKKTKLEEKREVREHALLLVLNSAIVLQK